MEIGLIEIGLKQLLARKIYKYVSKKRRSKFITKFTHLKNLKIYTFSGHVFSRRISFKKKARLLQWLVFFFRQTTELIAYVPLFTETDKFTQAEFSQCKLTAKGPPFRFLPFLRNLQNRKTPKGPPFQFFFGTVRFFFENF